MSGQWILSVIGVLTLPCLALCCAHQELGLGDELSLLQTELERASGASPDNPAAVEKVPAVKESFCHQLAAGMQDDELDDSCRHRATSEPWETPLGAQSNPPGKWQPPQQPKSAGAGQHTQSAEDAPPASTTTLAGAMLGYILDATVCALVLDGLRRWWQRRAGGMPPEGWDGLMQAALAGDTKRCEALLDNATPIIGSDLWGCTVLHAASKGGSVPVVKRLLEHGALVDEPDSWDETPLHLAARAGHANICELLLAHGAPIDAVNAQDWTPLVVAADAGHADICNLLLARGSSVAGLNKATLPPLLVCLLHASAPEEEKQAEEPGRMEEEDFWEEELDDLGEGS